MSKVFNVTGLCRPEQHYMVNLDSRLKEIKKLIDTGCYFTINRARQYGKTTILFALKEYLKEEYIPVFMDFQMLGADDFSNENTFSVAFAETFLWELKQNNVIENQELKDEIQSFEDKMLLLESKFNLRRLFICLRTICAVSNKPIVLMIDEVDSATNNQVFLDFLSQLRGYYLARSYQPTFQSVILAGVHDIKNLRRKIRPEEEHKVNSPWNIATDFMIDMSFSEKEIEIMLQEYEEDHKIGLDIHYLAKLIYNYTSGYPYLVSRLCKLMDEKTGWLKEGFLEAVKLILSEKNTLFESLISKLTTYSELNNILETLLFTGKSISYNSDNSVIDIALMFGFVKNRQSRVNIANRIFETRLYNFYLSTSEMKNNDIYKLSLQEKNQFITNGYLNVRLVLEKFVIHFNEVYGSKNETFLEEEGRKYFLLYLRPIINGIGNYYIEAQTRDMKRTDIIIDYLGKQYIIEMKIWHGEEYNSRGEKQLYEYLEYYHQNKGYMLSFNFNKNKEIGVKEIQLNDKLLIEAVV